MKLPFVEKAIISKSKIVDYLLSDIHPVGKTKSIVFKRFGFTVEQWGKFSDMLLSHAQEYNVVKTEPTPFGTRYIIEGDITNPQSRKTYIRTVWFIENDKEIPHFVTAYPV